MKRALTDEERRRLARLHSKRVESYLDAGHGACWLRRPRIALVVAEAVKKFDSERYDLFAWCIMPNHVHVVFAPLPGHDLDTILHSWKSFTAKKANILLLRTGPFWQVESYDHLIRDGEDFEFQVRYVMENPAKARLTNWPWLGRSTGILPVVDGIYEGRQAAPKQGGAEASPATDRTPPETRPPDSRDSSLPHGQDARAT